MRASRVVVVAAGCAAILAVGFALAPEPVAPLQLVTPVTSDAPATETP